MTSREPRRARPAVAAAAAITLAAVLAGCSSDGGSTGAATTGPAVAPTSASQDASSVLAAAVKAAGQTDATGVTAREAVFTQPALESANAAAKAAPALTPEQRAAADLDTSAAQVIGVSRTGVSPTQILFTSKVKSTGGAVLVLLTSPDGQDFKVAAVTPMLAGATLEALDPVAVGSPGIPDSGLAATPDAVMSDFAASVAYPNPVPATLVATNALTTSLTTAAAQDAGKLGTSGALVQKHVPQDVIGGLSLAAGKGAVVFGHLERTDTLTFRGGTGYTPSQAYQLITGVKKINSQATLTTNEIVAFVIPPTGPARVIAASEQLVAGSGS